jgi:hypothetical protein
VLWQVAAKIRINVGAANGFVRLQKLGAGFMARAFHLAYSAPTRALAAMRGGCG